MRSARTQRIIKQAKLRIGYLKFALKKPFLNNQNLCQLKDNINIKEVTSSLNNSFFGYYNISPWNPSNTKILLNETQFDGKRFSRKARLFLMLYCTNKKTYLWDTITWNYKYNCMFES